MVIFSHFSFPRRSLINRNSWIIAKFDLMHDDRIQFKGASVVTDWKLGANLISPTNWYWLKSLPIQNIQGAAKYDTHFWLARKHTWQVYDNCTGKDQNLGEQENDCSKD
jgi:hypothetical protein